MFLKLLSCWPIALAAPGSFAPFTKALATLSGPMVFLVMVLPASWLPVGFLATCLLILTAVFAFLTPWTPPLMALIGFGMAYSLPDAPLKRGHPRRAASIPTPPAGATSASAAAHRPGRRSPDAKPRPST